MSRIVVASTRHGAGKTSVILGIAPHLGCPVGYMKPLGDRLYYRKKRLWDHDAALCSGALALTEPPEDITIGFEQAKLRYMYDEDGMAERLRTMADRVQPAGGSLIIEAGQDCACGAAVHLDPLAMATTLDAKLLIVASGTEAVVLDDLVHTVRGLGANEARLLGVIVNKVADLDDFASSTRPGILDAGIPCLGAIPENPDLVRFSMAYLADYLFAKVVAGESGLPKVVHSIYVGAMSADELLRSTYVKSPNKLIITSGDRGDVILAAIETRAAGVVLTNNILPSANILSRASHAEIPVLVVASDTFQTAKRVDHIEPLIKADEHDRIDALSALVSQHVDIAAIAAS